jgi:hypothetical protein
VIAQLVLVIVPRLARPTFPWTLETVQVTAAPANTVNSAGGGCANAEETTPHANDSTRAIAVGRRFIDFST